MASTKIGKIKSRTVVSLMSNKALEDKITSPNSRGRDVHKYKNELDKRNSLLTKIKSYIDKYRIK